MMNIVFLFFLVLVYFTFDVVYMFHLITILITVLLIGILQPLHQHSTLLLQRSHSISLYGPLILPPSEDTLLLKNVQGIQLLHERSEQRAGFSGLNVLDVLQSPLRGEDILDLFGFAAADADFVDEFGCAGAGGEGRFSGLGGLEGAVFRGQELGGAADKGGGDGAAHHVVGGVVGEAEAHEFELGGVEVTGGGAEGVDEAVDGIVVEG